MEPDRDNPAPREAAEDRRRLALIEVQGPGGRVLHTHGVHAWPLRVGRALDNELVLDDPYVAPHHATLAPDDHGALRLTVADTRNGVRLGTRLLRAGDAAPLGPAGAAPTLHIGQTTLRVRLPGEALAPERPLPGGGLPVSVIAVCALLLMLIIAGGQWIQLDPGADTAAWLPTIIGVPVALLGWCGLWALASKLFQHRFDFIGHLRIALPWLLAIEVVEVLLPEVGAALAWPWLWRLMPPVQVLLLLLMVHRHLAHVLPQAGRRLGAAVAAVGVAGAALQLTLAQRATDRFSRPPYMSTLPLPALNLAEPVPASVLVGEMAPLAQRVGARAQRARDDDKANGEGSEDSE